MSPQLPSSTGAIAPSSRPPLSSPQPSKLSSNPTLSNRSSAPVAGVTNNRFRRLWGFFRGRARVRIAQRNVLTGRITRVTNHRTNVIARLSRPKQAAGIRERNPFSFSIGSTPAEIRANRIGSFNTFSAIPFNFRGGYLAQYWRFRMRGNRIIGNLSNTHQAEALVTNLFTHTRNIAGFVTPWPYAFRRRSSIRGVITRNRIRVTISGWDTGLSRRVTIRVDARRRR